MTNKPLLLVGGPAHGEEYPDEPGVESVIVKDTQYNRVSIKREGVVGWYWRAQHLCAIKGSDRLKELLLEQWLDDQQ